MSRAKPLGLNRPVRQGKKKEYRFRAVGFPGRGPAKNSGWLEIASSQPGVAIPINLVPVIIGIPIAIVSMSTVPIRPVIGTVIIRSVVIWVWTIIPVIAGTKPNTEVNLSVRTRRSRKHQPPSHDSNQQKFLHYSPPGNSTGKSVESFPVIRRREGLDIR